MQRFAPMIVVSFFVLSGCGRPAPEPAATRESAGTPATPAMPQAAQAEQTQPGEAQEAQQPQQPAEHVAQGTLNSIDSAAGMVNITHGPVASAGWPGMTMSFKLADTNAAANLKPGQRVEFHFTIESGMSATVTKISAAE